MEKRKAIEKLKRQLGAIEELRNKTYKSPEFDKWRRDTKIALERIFGEEERHVYEFSHHISYTVPIVGNVPPERRHKAYLDGLTSAQTLLQSIIDEITEYWQDEDIAAEGFYAPAKDSADMENIGSDVFVVHGRDEAAKQAVAGLIRKLELKPIILHDQPNAGRTIIEKFEDYANVGFAVVLMTPDDIGQHVLPGVFPSHKGLKKRARQNVIFELGFFIGKLGRKRVCALYKEGVELPSDYQGVLYVPMNKATAWELELAKEIKAAGLPVDLKKIM